MNYDWEEASLGRFDAFDVRQIAYWSLFAGAAGHTYGANEVWQMYKKENPHEPLTRLNDVEWDEALNYKGATQMKYIKELMLSFDYFSRKPDQSFIAKNPHDPPGRLTGTSGEGYAMVYTPTGKKLWIDSSKLTFEIKTTTWFNPRNGEKQAATSQPVDGLLVFDPPGEEERGNDWVLILME